MLTSIFFYLVNSSVNSRIFHSYIGVYIVSAYVFLMRIIDIVVVTIQKRSVASMHQDDATCVTYQ